MSGMHNFPLDLASVEATPVALMAPTMVNYSCVHPSGRMLLSMERGLGFSGTN